MMSLAQMLTRDGAAALWTRLQARLAPHAALLRRVGLIMALCGFAAGLFWAGVSISDLWDRIAIFPLVLLLVICVPSTIVLNAAEFRAMLQSVKAEMSWQSALEIAIYTSAANLLPIPGGVITRLGGMRARGVSMKQSSWMILLFAGVWAGVAFLLSGMAILLRNVPLGASLLLAGVAISALSMRGLRKQHAASGLVLKIFLIRAALQLVEMARLALAFRALGTGLSFMDAAAFSISSFVGTAVSVVPAGLGVTEAMVALLSPVMGLNPATGFLAAAINRVVVLAALAAVTSALLALSGRGFLKKTHVAGTRGGPV